jgi:hypothetical protein
MRARIGRKTRRAKGWERRNEDTTAPLPLGPGVKSQGIRVGQGVRLSELGLARSPKSTARIGTVVGLPGASTVDILFDGNKRATKLHRSYVELDLDDETTRRQVEVGLKAKAK